jgi:hypothetical protein
MNIEKIKEYILYNEETGKFFWVKPRKGTRKNKEAGRLDRNGYRTICFFGKHYLAHRLAWWYVHNEFPKGPLDHINRTKDDNRIENLRCLTISQNGLNTSQESTNISGRRGVGYCKRDKLWISYLSGKRLGSFKEKEDAIKCREQAEQALEKEFGGSGKYQLFYNKNTGRFLEV